MSRCEMCGREDDELAAAARRMEAERLRPIPRRSYFPAAEFEAEVAERRRILETLDDDE